MPKCRSCGADITWATTTGGKSIPLDPKPVPGGNVVYTDHRTVEVLGVERMTQDQAMVRYVSHFSTCPFANTHRKPH